jgi:serine phosphatase RsbU (regulator of sigma subunit)
LLIRLTGHVAGIPLDLRLPAGKHSIGRSLNNEVVLADPSVSRRHAEMQVEASEQGTTVLLRDLESRNGTFIGGRRIRGEEQARPGERVRFGEVELALADAGAAPPALTLWNASPGLEFSGDDLVQASRAHSWQELEQMPAGRDLSRTLLDALSETGNLLTVPRPEAELFDALLRLVERVIPARRLALLLSPEGGESTGALPTVRAVRPTDAGAGALLVSRTLLGTVLNSQAVLLVEDVQADQRFQAQASIVAADLKSALVAPLFDNEKVIGVLYADSNDPRIRFDQELLRAFALLANLVAVKITNARLLETRREKERMEQELATAARIQREMLPRELPAAPGYALAARLLPCYEAGGDLYEAALLADGAILLGVGDVSGKGMGAALLMSQALGALRLLAEESPPLTEMALRLYRQVARAATPGRFVTLFFGRLHPSQHRLEYVNCGHNPPFVVPAHGEARELPTTGLPLGMLPVELMPPGILTGASTDLAPGELLCVFSDGIPEATRDGEFFGEERLLHSLRSRAGQPLEQLADGVLDDVREFYAGAPPTDDITLLLVRREEAR